MFNTSQNRFKSSVISSILDIKYFEIIKSDSDRARTLKRAISQHMHTIKVMGEREPAAIAIMKLPNKKKFVLHDNILRCLAKNKNRNHRLRLAN